MQEGLARIAVAHASADAANQIQAASTQDTLAKLLQHEATMRGLNEQNMAGITAKFEEIAAARAASAAVGPLQQRDQAGFDWQAGRLGQPDDTGMPPLGEWSSKTWEVGRARRWAKRGRSLTTTGISWASVTQRTSRWPGSKRR